MSTTRKRGHRKTNVEEAIGSLGEAALPTSHFPDTVKVLRASAWWNSREPLPSATAALIGHESTVLKLERRDANTVSFRLASWTRRYAEGDRRAGFLAEECDPEELANQLKARLRDSTAFQAILDHPKLGMAEIVQSLMGVGACFIMSRWLSPKDRAQTDLALRTVIAHAAGTVYDEAELARRILVLTEARILVDRPPWFNSAEEPSNLIEYFDRCTTSAEAADLLQGVIGQYQALLARLNWYQDQFRVERGRPRLPHGLLARNLDHYLGQLPERERLELIRNLVFDTLGESVTTKDVRELLRSDASRRRSR